MKVLPWNVLMKVSARLRCPFLHGLSRNRFVFEKRPPWPMRSLLRFKEVLQNFYLEVSWFNRLTPSPLFHYLF